MRSSWCSFSILGLTLACNGAALGQAQNPMPPLGEFVEYRFDSGARVNVAGRSQTVFSEIVHMPQAAWARLFFEDVKLARGSVVRFTSLLDGEVQELDAQGMETWGNSTAYFNGDTVLVELVAAPGSRDNRLQLREVQVETIGGQQIGICGICGFDDRDPSDEDWSGRLMNPGVCSAAVFNTNSCLVSAGHCVDGFTGNQVIQFRVPNSFSNCNTNQPPVADQFPVQDKTYINAGVGSDWAVMTTGTNSQHGQTIYERYGEFRPLATSAINPGQSVDVWGFGTSATCTLNHVQQLSQGIVQQRTSSYYTHTADTTGGNSGSAILHDDEIIGVVSHCPCPNIATRIDLAAFAVAIHNLCPDPAPSNDSCSSPTVVGVGSHPFSNVGATTDGPAEPANCTFFGDDHIQNDVWFGHIAQCTGNLTISLCGSTYGTKLAVYPGAGCPTESGTVLACDAISCPDNRSEVTIPVTQGQALRIRVGGHHGAQGEGILTISCEEQTQCPGDLTDDGVVDVSDLLTLLAAWGPCPGCPADITEDDVVDVSDLLQLLSVWGTCDD